jgi:hypothetical protein
LDPSNLERALKYADRGWPVFPVWWAVKPGVCACPGGAHGRDVAKHPITTNGKDAATRDEATIRTWWTKHPLANIGIVTGASSGLVVLDVDPKHGGEASWAKLCQEFDELIVPPTVSTGGGGSHYYFKHPGGQIPLDHGRRLGPGVDVQGEGGYVIAPPSNHLSGGLYRKGSGEIYTLSEVLVEKLRRPIAGRRVRRGRNEAPSVDLDELTAGVKAGRRDDALFRFACRLRAREMPIAEALLLLEAAWSKVEQPSGDVLPLETALEKVRGVYAKFPPGRSSELLAELGEDDDPEPVFLDELEESAVTWLWQDRLVANAINILEGDPETGKSLLTLDLAARFTRGRPMPGSTTPRMPGGVVLVCAEDDVETTIMRRLRAADGDHSKVATVQLKRDEYSGQVVPLMIPEDLHRIEKDARRLRERRGVEDVLLIVDPISAYLGERINTAIDASVRRALTPLAEMASRVKVTVLMVRHLNKSGDMKALYRGGGSIGFTGAARAVYACSEHPQIKDLVVMARVKNNYTKRDRRSWTYRVMPWSRDKDIPVVEWDRVVELSADELLSKPDGRKNPAGREEAKRVLREIMKHGPVDSKKGEAGMKQAGFGKRLIEVAKEALNVVSRPVYKDDGFQIDRWEWAYEEHEISD